MKWRRTVEDIRAKHSVEIHRLTAFTKDLEEADKLVVKGYLDANKDIIEIFGKKIEETLVSVQKHTSTIIAAHFEKFGRSE